MKLQSNLLSPIDENFSINTPLIRVVIGTSKKTDDAATTLFEDYPKIVAKNKEQKQALFYNQAAYSASTLVVAAITATGSFMVVDYPLKIVASILGCGFTGLFTASSISYWHGVSTMEEIDKNDHILNVCDAIFSFSDAFKALKKNFLIDDVKPLFTHLEALTELFQGEKLKEFEGYDFRLFTSCSKFFLMDAVVQLLDDESIKDEWEQSLVFDILSDESVPWNRFDVTHPGFYACKLFLEMRKEIESLKIAKQMVTIFNQVVQDNVPI